MADLRPQYNEEAVGANHPTKTDVINRAYNVEHDEDGTHGNITTTLNLTSGQIAFPASAVPSADPHTLDDYEEGTWTMTVEFGGADVGVTYGANTGEYEKIGRFVKASGYMALTSKGVSNGNALLHTLPFTSKTVTGYSAAASSFNNISFADTYTLELSQDKTRLNFYELSNAGVKTALTDADFANDSAAMLSVSYTT